MKIFVSLIILFFTIGCGERGSQDEFYAQKGVLDLSDTSLNNKTIYLYGEWEFYWDRLIPPNMDEIERNQYLSGFLPPGMTWSGSRFRDLKFNNTGTATYRLKLILPEEILGEIYSLKFKTTGGAAYKIFIDDIAMEEIGKVGTDMYSTSPSRKGAHIQFPVRNQNTILTVQIASFHHFEGSFWYAPELGTSKEISKFQNIHVTIDSLLIGSILLMALYHLVIYYHRRELQSLYFSLFSLTVGLYQMSIGELIIFNIFENIPYLVAHRLLILFFLTAGFYISFLKSVFPEDIPTYFVRFVWIISIGMFGFAFFTPTEIGTSMERYATIFSVLVLFIGLIYLFRIVLKKRRDSKIMFMSNLVIWLGAINDGLVVFSYYDGITTLSYAIFFSIVIQSIFLARSFSRAFSDVESLSIKLRELNMELENKIEERTLEYRTEKEKAEQANLWKGKFIELVSHNIRSPLYGIYSSLELISDDTLDDEEERNELIKVTKASILNTTSAVENLLHSSRFLDDSIQIQTSIFKPYTTIQILISMMNIPAKAKNIKIENHVSEDFFVDADQDISTEVFRNLIVNAVKFTRFDGSIRIESKQSDTEEGFKIIDFIDNGVGISPDMLPVLFQSASSTTGTGGEKGFGIGLKRSQELMHLQGGRIEVESTIDVGSRFSVYFSL
ncbi:MAG: sensor histidine kinase [Leptospira sp.]|nr:sensor histidine kinase [Leptospira sp.]